jgi:hypothetical protein
MPSGNNPKKNRVSFKAARMREYGMRELAIYDNDGYRLQFGTEIVS